VHKVVESTYNREEFTGFLKDFLPEDYEAYKEPKELPLDRSKVIKSAFSLGESQNLEGLRVFEVEHEKINDPRVQLAGDVFRIMADTLTHRALVVFRNPHNDAWRLSLMSVTLDYDKAKNRVISKPSNPRRYSYILGEGAKTVTPEKFLIKKGRVSSFEDLISRFSVEVVNNEFYQEIARLYDELVGVDTKSGTLRYPEGAEAAQEFAVRLIGRIVFCWFLKEKQSDTGVPLVGHKILSLDAVKSSKDYYHNMLAPLFFEVLNKQVDYRKPRFQSGEFAKVPYLNGGLFAHQKEDHYSFDANTESAKTGLIDVPDIWLQKLFELLERYHFTVDENTSVDIDLSIDPEMLGRIFENLLARINPETGETVRKSTGSFYTPRQIVEYMVDECLLVHLQNKTDISEEKLRSLISYGTDDDLEDLLTSEEKYNVLQALYKITILDPACGSGAFPMGALQKIVYILSVIDPEAKYWKEKQFASASPELRRDLEKENFSYIRKLGVIRESIFGVDIQPIATEIARLRCFLTLVVDQNVDDSLGRAVKPLPNLDFKFVTANSLIAAPEEESDEPSLFGNFADQLAEAVDDYFAAEGDRKLATLSKLHELIDRKADGNIDYVLSSQKAIQEERFQEFYNKKNEKKNNKLVADARAWKSYKNIFNHQCVEFFEPKYFFPGVKGGFDIVIGNPPYVGEKGHKEIFRKVAQSSLGKRFYLGKMDFFYFFFHLGIDLLKPGGVHAFITTNYYITATSAKKLRQDFKERSTILQLINFGEFKIFESALGQHNMITILKKGTSDAAVKAINVARKGTAGNGDELSAILAGKDKLASTVSIAQRDLFKGSGNNIVMKSSSLEAVLDTLQSYSSLSVYFEVKKGLETGENSVFIFNEKPFFFHNLDKEGVSLLKPFYKNSDVGRYKIDEPQKLVLYFPNDIDLGKVPIIKRYLSEHRAVLENRAQIQRSKQAWYTLVWPRSQAMFENQAIVSSYRPPSVSFALSEGHFYAGTDMYFVFGPKGGYSLKAGLGILNSHLSEVWFRNRGKVKGPILEMTGDNIEALPMPAVEPEDETVLQIEKIVDQLISAKKEGLNNQIASLETQVNELVYKLYNLTEKEVEIVENAT
jgi:adenine-specific DNA-methyltransferase